MPKWEREFLKGKQDNIDENYNSAQTHLERAVSECPNNTISEIIFELGRSLFGQKLRGIAVGCMLTALKMGFNEPHLKNMMQFLVNDYGMPSNKSKEKDDEEAFKSIQVIRYLNLKKTGRFSTIAEKDMILDLIADAWKEYSASKDFSGLSARQKLQDFCSCIIIFPTINILEDDFSEDRGHKIGNFGKNLCPCGSGLPYLWCCGRIKTIEELENEAF